MALERQVAVKLGGWRFREFVQPILPPFYETSRLFYETSNNDSCTHNVMFPIVLIAYAG